MLENASTSIALPDDLSNLSTVIDEKPESFASGDDAIREVALQAAKFIFDLTVKSEGKAQPHISKLLSELSTVDRPQTRSQARAAAANANTPQPPRISNAILKATPLASLHVDSMEEEQIWAQLELKAKNVCETLEKVFDSSNMDPMKDIDGPDMVMNGTGDDDDDDDEDEDEDESGSDEFAGLEGMDWDQEEEDEEDEEWEGEEDELEAVEGADGDEEDLGEGITSLQDPSSDEGEDDEEEHSSSPAKNHKRRVGKTKVQSELDDEVFTLEKFNAEVEEAESQWTSRGSLSRDDDESEDEESEELPIDFFAPIDADAEAFDEEDVESPSGEAYYEDFFGPLPRDPKKKGKKPFVPKPRNSKVRFHDEVKVKNIKSQGKGIPLSLMKNMVAERGDEDEDEMEEDEMDDFGMDLDDAGDENGKGDAEEEDEEEDEDESEDDGDMDDGHEAVERLKDDLFADDDGEAPNTELSTHEKRMEDIRKQIAALEAENVAEKNWVLKGEVNARGRPQNALLEEDLDFEQITKPVPVVTEEVVQDLEARIKARIIEGRFDDVVRKRPVDDKPFLPSRFFELQDTKSKDSLAQIYEKEFMSAQGGAPLDDRDGKLRKEHEEIEKSWENISYKLDALCNAHFTPKQPKAIISTVTNVAAVTLESALPTAQSTSTILAPEEVFTAESSALQARSEMTPAEKRTARSRDRKRKQQQSQRLALGVDRFAHTNGVKKAKGAKEQKEAALSSIVKSGKGVTVIGKKSPSVDKKRKRSKT